MDSFVFWMTVSILVVFAFIVLARLATAATRPEATVVVGRKRRGELIARLCEGIRG